MNYKLIYSKIEWLIPILILLFIWELLARILLYPEGFFPSFTTVLITSYTLIINGVLLTNLLSSLFRVIMGFVMGSVTGILLGILMGYKERVYKALHPLFSILMPIPALGWLPILIIWVGVGETLPIIIIFLCSFFPVLYNTITGIKQVDTVYVDIARTLGASNRRIFFTIIMPLALPDIFTGLRLEAGMAWRVLMAAEMIAIPTGIGALLINSQYLLRVDVIIVCLGVLALMTLLFEKILLLLENKFVKWR